MDEPIPVIFTIVVGPDDLAKWRGVLPFPPPPPRQVLIPQPCDPKCPLLRDRRCIASRCIKQLLEFMHLPEPVKHGQTEQGSME